MGEKHRCDVCGSEVEVIRVGGSILICCGQEMIKADEEGWDTTRDLPDAESD
ncbi:hypothetical protein KAR91_44340 [Candidatus Pacearchaeota archaeon]|nr:hypothetical protein [Candidatus Pacearchaeota archaeon]